MPISRAEQVKVTDLAADGYGVIRLPDTPAIMVPFTIEEETITIRVTRRKRQVWYGEALYWHETSPHRVAPACADFGRCGGCRWQMMSYEHQLHHKRRFVEQALHHIGKIHIEVPPVIPSPQIWHYRNKAEYAFGQTPEGKLVLGFHPRGEFAQVLPIQDCQIVPEAFEVVRRTVLEEAQKLKLLAYDPRTHRGFLRALLLRGTPQQVIALLILAEDRPEVAHALLSPLRHLLRGYGYIYNPKKNDSLHDLTPVLLWGTLALEYTVAGRSYRIGPKDFFQVNLSQADNLIHWMRERLPAQRVSVLYDLYGGVGLFGVALADRAERVYLIEKLPEAIESARENFRRNQSAFPFTHWEAIVGAAEDIEALAPVSLSNAVAIVDPPREGLHPKVRRFLRQGRFETIFYVSCHPATQARDLAELANTYKVVAVQPFDLFPHTTSIENVALLEKR